MNLFKAYGWLPHDLLIAKSEGYGLGNACLFLLKYYLANRKQRNKVGSSYSDWFEFIRGIPQGSISGPLRFNFFIDNMYLLKCKNPTFVNFQMIIRCIFVAKTYKLLLNNDLTWFEINSMKANPKKFPFMILRKTKRPKHNLLFDSNVIKESADVELLGLLIIIISNFEKHIA